MIYVILLAAVLYLININYFFTDLLRRGFIPISITITAPVIIVFILIRIEARRRKQISSLQKQSEKLSLSFETINKETQVLRILNTISESFVESTNLEAVFNQILDSIKEILKVDISAIVLTEDYEKQQMTKIIRGKDDIDFDSIVYKKAILNGSSILINNLSPSHTEYKNYQILYDQGFRSLLIAPLRIKKEIIGFISACAVHPYDFSGIDLRFLTTFSIQSALIIQNARLLETNMRLAITDEMTQIYNFRHFSQKIEEEFYRASRYKRPLSLLMIDIDHFKNYNDTYGHPVGDIGLRKIAYVLKTNTRPTDFVFRYGGEEFAIILIETKQDEATMIAERIRDSVSKTAFLTEKNKPTGKLTITIGIATYPTDTRLSSELVRNADIALYKGKRSGRNKVVLH